MFTSLKHLFSSFTRRERRGFFAALAVFVASGAFLLGAYVQNSTTLVPAAGGTYTEGLVGQPTSVNPVLAQSDADRSILPLVFSPLQTLAEKIEADPAHANRVWDVRLKDDIFWADGEKVTSDDVFFTIQKIQDPESQSPALPLWTGIAVSRFSERELQFTLPVPYAFFGAVLSNLYLVPKHVFADVPVANWRLSEYNLKPLGNGPYAVTDVNRRPDGFISALVFSPNKRFAGDPPHLATVALRFFPNQDELVKTFNAGRIDGWFTMEPDYLAAVKRPYRAVPFWTSVAYSVFFNPGKNDVLKDYAVREALVESVDKSALIQSVFPYPTHLVDGPVVAPTASLQTATSGGPAAAVALLESDGWHQTPDGVRAKATGRNSSSSLTFTLTVPQVPFLAKTAAFLADQWKAVGIAVHLQEKPTADIEQNELKNRDYELLLYGTTTGGTDDLYPFWHSSQRFSPGLNFSLYSNKAVDSLLEDLRQNGATSTGASDLQQLQSLVTEDAPALFLYAPTYLYVLGNPLQGLPAGYLADPGARFESAANWYLKTSRVFKK